MFPVATDPLYFVPDRLQARTIAVPAALAGLSAPYLAASGIKCHLDFEAARGRPVQVYFEPGAFALSVDRAAAGLCDLPLVVNHRYADQLATTGAGTLKLFEDAEGLKFIAATGTVPEEFTGWKCSAGFGFRRHELHTLNSGVLLVRVFAATLTEVTLTPDPLFTQTWTRRLQPGET